MEILSFDFDDELASRFAELPGRLRAGEDTDQAGEAALLSRQNPFFAHGHLRRFLAVDAGGTALGRLAAIVDPRLEDGGRPIGQVGFFDCIDDFEVAQQLLDRAVAWLSEQGRQVVWGPMNFSIFHSYRFMTRGFERTAFAGEPRNPPHYPELFTRYGFRPRARYFSWDLTGQHLSLMAQMAGFVRQAHEGRVLEQGYRFRPLDAARFDEEFASFFALMVRSFDRNLGHVPLSFEEFAFAHAGASSLIDPELMCMVEAPGGGVCAAAYLYPDRVPGRLILHTMMADREHRKRNLVEVGFGVVSEVIARKGFDSAIGALAREGPTLYDKTGPASREYTLFCLGDDGAGG